jgi:hypothetical protein
MTNDDYAKKELPLEIKEEIEAQPAPPAPPPVEDDAWPPGAAADDAPIPVAPSGDAEME